MILDRRYGGYMDYNASVPMPEEVRRAVEESMGRFFGNGSSVHGAGREVRGVVEETRVCVGNYLGCDSEDIIFTSGATESNGMVMRGIRDVSRVCVVGDGHDSVWENRGGEGGKGGEVLGVDGEGRIDLGEVERVLGGVRGEGERVVLVMTHANGETGVIQDVEGVVSVVRESGKDCWLHVDGTQALGHVDVSVGEWGVDSYGFSGHKLGSLTGVGGLYVKKERRGSLSPLMRGGGQERGFRSGSVNVHGVVSLGAVLLWWEGKCGEGERERQKDLRDEMEVMLKGVEGCVIAGEGVERLGHVSCFRVGGVKASKWLIEMDMAGVCVSSGSACASGKVGDSKVLEAMGWTKEEREGMVRVSLGWASEREDVEKFMSLVREVSGRGDVRGGGRGEND